MTIKVRELRPEDYAQWRLLWDGYVSFYNHHLDESVTKCTWERALNPDSALLCRVAETEGKAIGFALCVLHEGTWTTAPLCYLEDLYVDADARGMGAGKALLDALQSEGKREGWSMLYWMTRQENPARRLYDRYAGVDDFVRYRVPL